MSATADRPSVAILLSTYNGAAYLPALLDSLNAQTLTRWVLLWRDDGSSDDTVQLMQAWGAAHPNRLIQNELTGVNFGVTGSFLTLLRAADEGGFRYAAFADQDDVWLPEKLGLALSALGELPEAEPALYCARQVLVDGALNRIGLSAPLGGPASFPASLTQNIATGNTVMLNRPAIALIAPTAPPRETWHDWWCYMMVTAVRGRVLRDDRGVILYRQHGANVVGAPISAPQRALSALRRGPAAFMSVFRKNVAALQQYSALLDPAAQQELEIIARSLRSRGLRRLRALILPGFIRTSPLQTALFRLWFLIG